MFSNRYKKLTPYVAGEQPKDKKYIKLNTNENAHSPSPKVKEVLENFDTDRLKLYPDPNFTGLRDSIANAYAIDAKNVFVGNGSDEVLSFIFFTFFDNKNGKLLFPNFTYSFYPVYCDFYSIEFDKVPLQADFTLDFSPYLKEESCGVIFPNPNAPTSIAVKSDTIREFMDAYPKDRVVVVDEAYIDFAKEDEDSLKLVKDYKNLIIVRTFSKGFSLAGMRVGFVIADEAIIDALYNTKDSFNSYPCDAISLDVAKAAIDDIDYYRYSNKKIVKTRDKFSGDIQKLGWNVLPSSANFVFASHPTKGGAEVYKFLRDNGILVRFFDKDVLRDYVRITIGNEREMDLLTRIIWELGK